MKFTIGLLLSALLFAISLPVVQAQQIKFLDLVSALEAAQADSIKIPLLYKLSAYSRNSNPDQHKAYALEGLAIAQKLSSAKDEIQFLRELGIYHRRKGTLDSALYFYELAQGVSMSKKDTMAYHSVTLSKANVYKSQGEYAKAVSHFLEAIRFFEFKDEVSYRQNRVLAQFNLAGVYITIADYAKALGLLRILNADPLALQNTALMRSIGINLMAVYVKTEDLDSALFFGRKAEVIAKQTKSKRSLAYIATNLGAIYEKQDRYKAAQGEFEKALVNFRSLGDEPGVIKSLNNLGNIYTLQGEYEKASEQLLRSQARLLKSSNIYSLKHNFEMLTSLYSKQGAHLKAFDAQQQLMQLKDSILGIEQRQGIEQLQTAYETEKKELLLQQATQEKALAQLSATKNRSRLIQGGAVGGMALLSLFSYLVLFRSKKQKQLLSLELDFTRKHRALESDFNNAELKAIKAQMNPHFLFNAMSSVQGLILDNKKKEACSYLAKLSGLVRKNLELTAKQFVEANDELELIETYLKLEQMRLGKSFQYKIEGATSLGDLQLPAMIIQPFLENAIKHGLLHRVGVKTLNIKFEAATVLTCTITDNGVGRAQAKDYQSGFSQHHSFSTEAIARRFELLQHESEPAVGFEIRDLKAEGKALGTEVILKMPFKYDSDE